MSRRFPPSQEPYASLLRPYSDARRRHQRAHCAVPAELTLAGGAKQAGKVEQISEGGLLFVGRSPIEPGQIAELRFPEPVAGRILFVGVQCRWSTASRGGLYKAGFSFEPSPSAPVELFRAYVAYTAR